MGIVLYDNPVSTNAMKVRFLLTVLGLDYADPEELAEAIYHARKKLDLMGRFVADNGTVLGAFSIADCAFAPVLWRWYRLPLSFDLWPKVALLRDSLAGHPAFAAMGPVA